jgi:hypothetical protein
MLKSSLKVKENLCIKKFDSVNAYLKQINVGHHAKKSEVLYREHIEKFLLEAADETYLFVKAQGVMRPERCLAVPQLQPSCLQVILHHHHQPMVFNIFINVSFTFIQMRRMKIEFLLLTCILTSYIYLLVINKPFLFILFSCFKFFKTRCSGRRVLNCCF